MVNIEKKPLQVSCSIGNTATPLTCQDRTILLLNSIKADVISYMNEYGLGIGRGTPEVLEKLKIITDAANSYDVVVFAKKGCGYCERAKKMLSEEQVKNPFRESIIIGTESNMKTALGVALNLSDVTFPQIIIKGVYIGGHDNLLRLVSSQSLPSLINAEPTVTTGKLIKWYPPLELEANTPQLFRAPSMTTSSTPVPWYLFQPFLYGNLIRYISIIHVIILGICLGLSTGSDNSASKTAIYVFLIYLCIDCGLIVIHGPAPFSPSGTLSTYLFWKYRGNVTSSIPYKFVFSVYFMSFIHLLSLNYNSKSANIVTLSTLNSTLFNSILLTIFRF